MKLKALAMMGIGFAIATSAAVADTTTKPLDLKPAKPGAMTEKQKLSYTIGVDLGTNFKKQSIDIDADLLLQGIQDVQAGKPPRLSKEEMIATLKEFQKQLIAKRQEAFKELADKNKQAGEKFLTENKAKPEVKTTDSGLQYKVLEEGKGDSPSVSDTVTVEYTGTLINGNVFDSTEKSGKPVSFKVNEVIPGWTEALQIMKPGATWEIYVPSDLAYGAQGAGGPIGPNETLIFKIHLISVSSPADESAADQQPAADKS